MEKDINGFMVQMVLKVWLNMKIYNAKGRRLLRFGRDGIEIQTYDYSYYLNYQHGYHKDLDMCHKLVKMKYEYDFNFDVYDLFNGKKFLELVKSGCITDYDGHIVNVFIDGFDSNLGLATDNLTSGGFLVDEEVWLELCNEHKVEVNWANK